MLDFATRESVLEAKRRELAAMIAEGRQVVAALSERQTAVARKIEMAREGIQRLQAQIEAIDTVMDLVDHNAVTLAPPRPAPVLEVVASEPEPRQEAAPPRAQPFKPAAYLKCVADGHDFMHSRSMPGQVTCRRCRTRRKA